MKKLNRYFKFFILHFSFFIYSYLSDSTGFCDALRHVCPMTVSRVMNTVNKPANRKSHQLMSV